MPIQTYFARLQNPDMSIDSICMDCYRTVANTRSEADLIAAEQGHACSTSELEHYHTDSQRGTF
jgi:hypothetical protein